MSQFSRVSQPTSILADLNAQARTIAAFAAPTAGIDAEIAAEAARQADATAEQAHIRAKGRTWPRKKPGRVSEG